MVALAEPLVAVRESDFDRDPYLLNAANGTINLKTGEIREHRRDDMITRLAGAEYHPDAWHPDADTPWNRFLRDVTGGDEELMAFLQRVVGYSITGDVREEVFFIIHGPPGSGKSTFVEAVRAALGDYARQADFETFLRRPPTGAPRNDIARLAGARLVASIEVERGRQLAEALVKQLTGGDTIAARFLYREAFEFTPQFKLFLVANILPRADDLDPGLWRRVICIPFLHVVPDARRDNQLKQRLRSEARDEILAWAVRGCLDWRRVGLQPPQVVKQAVAEYREQQDPLRDWLQACCVIGQAYYATSAELWESFQAFGGGISRREFNERLKALGCKADKGRQGNRVWRGIGLLPSP
jgi:putative DNA primase/helicase